MSKICCHASNCGYNENNRCEKKKINIEGVFAKSKLGTFCESFSNPNIEAKAYMEMAKEMFDNDDQKENKINCSASYCKYNDNDCCSKKEIQVEGISSKYRSETSCDSFLLK